MRLDFVKMHGLGNDFVVIDDRACELDIAPEAVEWLCDRNFGIGADGLMLVRPATVPDADWAWWFRNADGTVAEMCGNGIRCIGKYVVDRGLVSADQDVVRIETALGVMEISVTRADDGTAALATVDMGEPILAPAMVPTTLRAPDAATSHAPGAAESDDSAASYPSVPAHDVPVIDQPLETPCGTFMVTTVSMGNPHCVIWVDDVESFDVCGVGSAIETHPAFPRKTNVEFAQIIDAGSVLLRVWERGVGETLACGTGSCATVVAGVLSGRLERDVTVELPGGELQIRWPQDGHVHMTGPATEVFSGSVEIPED